MFTPNIESPYLFINRDNGIVWQGTKFTEMHEDLCARGRLRAFKFFKAYNENKGSMYIWNVQENDGRQYSKTFPYYVWLLQLGRKSITL